METAAVSFVDGWTNTLAWKKAILVTCNNSGQVSQRETAE